MQRQHLTLPHCLGTMLATTLPLPPLLRPPQMPHPQQCQLHLRHPHCKWRRH